MKGCTNWTLKTVADRSEPVGECLIWQQLKNGSGMPVASYNGRCTTVRRIVWRVVTGSMPPEGKRISMRCKNIDCVRYECMVLRTPSQEQLAAGKSQAWRLSITLANKRRANNKLSPEKVAAIRESDRSHEDLAREHGVGVDYMRSVRKGRGWAPALSASSVFALGGAA